MGSLRDYGRNLRSEPLFKKKRGGFGRMLAVQSVLAVVMFFLIAGFISAEGTLGEGARFIAGQGVAPANSWIQWGDGVPVDADPQPNGQLITSPDEQSLPVFTAPASGVVVSDLAITVSGFASEKGILIQGAAGQNIKAAAAGSVAYLGSNEQGYIVEIVHGSGFSSIYQGISTVEIAAGDELDAGQVIGTVDNGEVTFSLILNGEEVDPLEYLFN